MRPLAAQQLALVLSLDRQMRSTQQCSTSTISRRAGEASTIVPTSCSSPTLYAASAPYHAIHPTLQPRTTAQRSPRQRPASARPVSTFCNRRTPQPNRRRVAPTYRRQQADPRCSLARPCARKRDRSMQRRFRCPDSPPTLDRFCMRCTV